MFSASGAVAGRATKPRLAVGSLFPKSAVARDDFQDIVPHHCRRNGIVGGEDVAVALRQQAGIERHLMRTADRF